MHTQSAFRHVSSAPRPVYWTGGINYAALREALDLLEVKWPVRIRVSNGQTRRGCARVRLVKGQWEHHITVSRNLTIEQANETLLHELTHASQAERFDTPKKFPTAYNDETARAQGAKKYDRYRANKYEVEARDNAAALKDELQLTRRGK